MLGDDLAVLADDDPIGIGPHVHRSPDRAGRHAVLVVVEAVHLSSSAVRVLEALPRKPGNPWVIPGNKPGRHMTDIDAAWETIRARAGLHDVRIHDIRHSCAA